MARKSNLSMAGIGRVHAQRAIEARRTMCRVRHNKLDLNLLTALRALLLEKNVTRAGDSVHVTQSAMSGILARLREYFGDPLIVQIGRKMELTPLAESLIEPVNDVLLRIDATIATRPGFDPATSRRSFSVVASDYVINVLLIDVLRRIHHEAPGMSLEFRIPSEGTSTELEAGEIDLAIYPESQNTTLQSGSVLFEDSYVIMVDVDNREVGDSIGIEQYLNLRHVAYKSTKYGLPHLETWLANRFGEVRHVEVTTHSFQLLPQLVIGTARLATMHVRLAHKLAAGLPVRIVPPAFDIPRLVEVLQWHKYRDLDPGSMWLRDVIIDAARKLPALESL